MKKVGIIITIALLICFSVILLVSCEEEPNELPTAPPPAPYTHEITVNNRVDLERYFEISESSSYYDDKYTLSIEPKIPEIAEYSGNISLKVFTVDEDNNTAVIANPTMNIDYYGKAEIVFSVPEYSKPDFSITAVAIKIILHDEGLSGNTLLKYTTVTLTKYNYNSYLNVSASVNREYDYTSHEYTYKIVYRCSASRNNDLSFFNNVNIVFSDGTILPVDASGEASYRKKCSSNTVVPRLSNITGIIEIYPDAIYKY